MFDNSSSEKYRQISVRGDTLDFKSSLKNVEELKCLNQIRSMQIRSWHYLFLNRDALGVLFHNPVLRKRLFNLVWQNFYRKLNRRSQIEKSSFYVTLLVP